MALIDQSKRDILRALCTIASLCALASYGVLNYDNYWIAHLYYALGFYTICASLMIADPPRSAILIGLKLFEMAPLIYVSVVKYGDLNYLPISFSGMQGIFLVLLYTQRNDYSSLYSGNYITTHAPRG